MIYCQGAIATNGYYVAQLNTTIYSIEELAYLCAHKGYRLDSDFVCKELVNWVLEECDCEELAYRLQAILREKGDKTAFVEAILRFSACVKETEIEHILQDIAAGLNLSGYERKKLDADNAFYQRQYAKAATLYEALIEILPVSEEELLANAYYNLAVTKAQMFLYAEAMEAFEASYQILATEDTLRAWLKAARMYYPENQYLGILGGREDLYALSLELEEEIKNVEANFIVNEESQELEKLNEWLQYGGKEGYRVASARVLRDLCETYREYHNVAE